MQIDAPRVPHVGESHLIIHRRRAADVRTKYKTNCVYEGT